MLRNGRKIDAAGEEPDFWMLVEGDTIVSTGRAVAPRADLDIDLGGKTLVPGFIDLHSHGAGGHAYEDGASAIRSALRVHRSHGTTRSLISLVSNPLETLRSSLAIIAELTRSDELVLGAHLEGPFLSDARRGAHDPTYLRDPEPAAIDGLLEAAQGTLRMITLAPERTGALEAIDAFVAAGVVVALGHTEAPFNLAREAIERGARVLTHAFNGMPGLHHREPGVLGAALADERVVLEVILDGVHVHPTVAAIAFRSAPGRIALVTDAMAAAGSVDGEYSLGAMRVTVTDGRAVLSGTNAIAGSTLTQDAAVRRAITESGVSAVDAVAAATATPARVLGREQRFGMLAPGFAADAVVLDADWQVARVWANGTEFVQAG